jgi:hypothetical protein
MQSQHIVEQEGIISLRSAKVSSVSARLRRRDAGSRAYILVLFTAREQASDYLSAICSESEDFHTNRYLIICLAE